MHVLFQTLICWPKLYFCLIDSLLARVVQSVMCLTADTCLTADPGVASSIEPVPILSWRFVDHEIISIAILLPSTDSRVTSKSMCTKYWLTA